MLGGYDHDDQCQGACDACIQVKVQIHMHYEVPIMISAIKPMIRYNGLQVDPISIARVLLHTC